MSSLAKDRLHGLAGGAAVKAPVRVATSGDIVLSGLQTVDGVALAGADRVLVKGQSDATANGLYEVDAGGWSRAPDFDGPRDVVAGTRVYVTEGAAHGGKEFVLTTLGDIAVGSTALTFEAMAALAVIENRITATRATATAGQSVFPLGHVIAAVLVTVNGAVVDEADFVAADGVTIVFSEGLNAGDAVVAYSLNGAVNAPTAAFNARLSADALNVTGAGTAHAILFDAIDFDDGDGDFAAATGLFTAPKTGRYQLSAAVTVNNVTAVADEFELRLVTSARAYATRFYRTNDQAQQATLNVSVLAEMSQGDTAGVDVRVAGEAGDTVDLVGGADGSTHFSGFLVR